MTGEKKSSKYLVFVVGTQHFAVPLKHVREVIAMQKLTPMPRSPAHLKGLLNVRGRIIQVMDLAQRLNLPAPEKPVKRPSLIISEIGDAVIGTTVDDVLEVRVIHEDQLGTPGELNGGTTPDHVTAIARFNEGPLTQILNLERVFKVAA